METNLLNLRFKGKGKGSKTEMIRWELMNPKHPHRSQAINEMQADKIDVKKDKCRQGKNVIFGDF